MDLTKTLGRVGTKKSWAPFKSGAKSPLFIALTFLAIKNCLKIATEHYGRLHYNDEPANAFRHALWNYLIAKRCSDLGKNGPQAISWSKKITDWHEEVFQNDPLARTTDFYNSAVGKNLFSMHGENGEEQIMALLREMTGRSKKITVNTDLAKFKNQLVHSTDTHEG